MIETEKRYTISKLVAENLEGNGWQLIETFYSKDYGCDVYHLEREKKDDDHESSRT